MPPLPWIDGRSADTPAAVVVMASRLELTRHRDVPAFLLAALRLRRLFRRADGGVGLALLAEPRRRTFWTVSAWDDHASIGAYNRHEVHAAVVERFRPRMAGSTFTTWSATAADLPVSWADARERLAAAGRPAPAASTASDQTEETR